MVYNLSRWLSLKIRLQKRDLLLYLLMIFFEHSEEIVIGL